MRLSTKLIIVVGGLATLFTTFALIAISFFIYLSTEQQIRLRLTEQAHAIATENIRVEADQIKLIDNSEGLTLPMRLREYDLSFYLFDQKKNNYAQYGIYKDLEKPQKEIILPANIVDQVLSKTKGVYRDISLSRYGMYDTYTMPILTTEGNRGYLQVASQNTLWPMLQKGMLISFALLMPFIWVISLFVAIFSARTILLPLNRLVEYINAINTDHLPKKIYLIPTLDQEVAALTRAFNFLLKRVTQSIVRQKEVAENISHELKTPLARISSSLDVLIRHSDDAAKLKLTAIRDESINLGMNVDTILAIASPTEISQIKPIDPKPIIKELINNLDQNLNFDLEIKNNFLIKVDKSVFQIVARNILENASHYNIKNGFIKINGESDESNWSLNFINSTAPDQKINESLLSRWERGTKTNNGHGLGLAIVRELCQKNGMSIMIQKNDSGEVLVSLKGK